MEAAMYSIWSELEGTIKHLLKDSLASVDQQTQGLRKKPYKKTEQMQSGLQGAMTSLDHKMQGTQIDIQTTKALVETTQSGLKAKVAEVTDDFIHRLDLSWHELEMKRNSRLERHRELANSMGQHSWPCFATTLRPWHGTISGYPV
jgi:hypothetical protein